MENFTFFNPTQIEFGTDKEKLIGQHLAESGIKKVLLCYGSERIKREGLFEVVSKSLSEKGIAFVECGGIVSNPLLSKVHDGIALAREHQVDAILSVGGGSVLDSSKAIAAGVCHDGDVWDLFVGKASIESALPLFAILTLAATGSEMNPGAVVTNDETKEKFFISSAALFPKVSIVNPALMQGVSRDYLVYSASDVIAHLIEAYFTATVHPKLQSRLVEAIINTVIETTEALLVNPADYDARAQFAWAATLALNGLTFSGTAGFGYPNHAIETLNFLGQNAGIVSASDFFVPDIEALSFLTNYVNLDLRRQNVGSDEEIDISHYAELYGWAFFDHFNFNEAGMRLNLSSASGLPHVLASHEVYVPWEHVSQFLAPVARKILIAP